MRLRSRGGGDELLKKGQQLYSSPVAYCQVCHGADGKGGYSGPPLQGMPKVTGAKEALIRAMFNHRIESKDKPVDLRMQNYSYMADGDLAAILTYVRNSFGNKTGDVVTAQDVKAQRK